MAKCYSFTKCDSPWFAQSESCLGSTSPNDRNMGLEEGHGWSKDKAKRERSVPSDQNNDILISWEDGFLQNSSRKLINQSSYSFSHGKRNQQNLFTLLYFYPPQPVANPGGFLPPFTLLKKIQPEVKEKSFLSSFTLAHGRVPWALAEKVHLGHQSSPCNGQNKAKKRRQKQSSLIYSLAFFTLSLCNSLRQQW